jgi:hypothetical protein
MGMSFIIQIHWCGQRLIEPGTTHQNFPDNVAAVELGVPSVCKFSELSLSNVFPFLLGLKFNIFLFFTATLCLSKLTTFLWRHIIEIFLWHLGYKCLMTISNMPSIFDFFYIVFSTLISLQMYCTNFIMIIHFGDHLCYCVTVFLCNGHIKM